LQKTSFFGGPNLAWKKKEKEKEKQSRASFAASRLAPMTHSFYYRSYPFANTKSFHSKLLVHNAVLHQKILNRVLRHDSKSSKELTWVSVFLSILRNHNKMLTTHSTKKNNAQERTKKSLRTPPRTTTTTTTRGWDRYVERLVVGAAAATAACLFVRQ
jgi:hypothetical protein